MILAPFDVVVVPFPYSDIQAEKRRPALVICAPEMTRATGKLWVAMITSRVGRRMFGDYGIEDLDAAGLPVASLVRAAKIATLEADRVIRRAGRLSPADQGRAMAELDRCAGF